MGAGDLLAGELVDGTGQALGDAACVDEEDGGGVRADDLEQARVDALPDAGALGPLRCGAAGRVLDFAEARHVFDGNFDGEFESFARAGVDDGDGAVADRGDFAGEGAGVLFGVAKLQSGASGGFGHIWGDVDLFFYRDRIG